MSQTVAIPSLDDNSGNALISNQHAASSSSSSVAQPPTQQRQHCGMTSQPLASRSDTNGMFSSAIQQSSQANDQAIAFSESGRFQSKHKFHALYTKHKTQKRKVWHDGRIDLTSNHQAILYASEDVPGVGHRQLDSCSDILPTQAQAIRDGILTSLETDNYLIQVEGPWVSPSSNQHAKNMRKRKPLVSSGMQKIMKQKFKKPSFKAPPRQRPHSASTVLAKRKKPLQPGELHRQHYGVSQQHFPHQQPYLSQAQSGMQSHAQQPYSNMGNTGQGPSNMGSTSGYAGQGYNLPPQGSSRYGHPPMANQTVPSLANNHTNFAPAPTTLINGSLLYNSHDNGTAHDSSDLQPPSATMTGQARNNQPLTHAPNRALPDHSNPQPTLQCTVPQQQQQASRNTTEIRTFQSTSRNGFDPSSYYGEEEEDDYEEETTVTPFALASPQTNDNTRHSGASSTSTSEHQQDSHLFSVPPATKTAQRSTNDLLHLFGSTIPSQLTTSSSCTDSSKQLGGEFDLPAAESSDEEDDD